MLLVKIYHLLTPGSRFQQWPIPSSADRCARNLTAMQEIPATEERLAEPLDTRVYLPSPAALLAVPLDTIPGPQRGQAGGHRAVDLYFYHTFS